MVLTSMSSGWETSFKALRERCLSTEKQGPSLLKLADSLVSEPHGAARLHWAECTLCLYCMAAQEM